MMKLTGLVAATHTPFDRQGQPEPGGRRQAG